MRNKVEEAGGVEWELGLALAVGFQTVRCSLAPLPAGREPGWCARASEGRGRELVLPPEPRPQE